jgi:hypothetical protein
MHNDPIFAAIDLYQSTRASCARHYEHDCGCDASVDAWCVLRTMTPTTVAGFVAKLRVLAAEDTIDQEEGDAEGILRTIFEDFAALEAAA